MQLFSLCWMQGILYTNAAVQQETVPITSDGWRPILGTHKTSYGNYEHFSTVVPTVTTLPSAGTSGFSHNILLHASLKPSTSQGRNKNAYSKHFQVNPYFALANHGMHGLHIPVTAVTHTHPGQSGQIKKIPSSAKSFVQLNGKWNVKPQRSQASTQKYRDDILTASATSGAYTLYKQDVNHIKTRETVGLGLPTANQYPINQLNGPIELANRFALPPTSESVFEQYSTPLQTFFIGKNPQTNDVNLKFQNQNVQFPIHLVPPPLLEKKEPIVKQTHNEHPKLNIPQNVVLQLPQPFQFPFKKITEPQIQVQVTKEKLNVFHNNVPTNYNGQYVEYDYQGIKQPSEPPKPAYEVTEGKLWQENPQYVRSTKPTIPPKRRPELNVNIPVFLPTPYRPKEPTVLPTSPTQNEVSTIFKKLSQVQREKTLVQNLFSYDVKEVSTHYPIFGKPVFSDDADPSEISNEITTLSVQEDVTTTARPQRVQSHRRRRPENKRPTTTTEATTENNESQKSQENETFGSVEIDKAVTRRLPVRYRTTTPSFTENEDVSTKVNRGRNKYSNRYRNKNTEVFNHGSNRNNKPAITEISTEDENLEDQRYRKYAETEIKHFDDAVEEKSEEVDDVLKTDQMEVSDRHYVTEPTKNLRFDSTRPILIEVSTAGSVPTTNLVVPEKEADLTLEPIVYHTTTSIPTTTTTATKATSSHRIKGQSVRFDNSNRPRFSVKDYRQKLNQYTSTTTPEPRTTFDSSRVRHSNRLRRPTSTVSSNIEEESTETVRSKFTPKEPRHGTLTEGTNEEAIITEKNVKSVNTRLRPFVRFRTTTTSSTTTKPKLSIKTNLFTRRRPPMLSLKSKIYGKYHVNETETKTDVESQETETAGPTVDYQSEEKSQVLEDVESTTSADVSKIDTFSYSQRVSDLTSSSKNDYNTPGVFKSVSPTSRRIPNYFTIATDDPILPIEAFFSKQRLLQDS